MKVCPIYSSSKANMYLVSHGGQYLMLDAGATGRKMVKECASLMEDMSQLQGIFITHHHADHCQGLRVFLETYHKTLAKLGKSQDISVYAHPKTFIPIGMKEPALKEVHIPCQEEITLGVFTITPFKLPHDAYCQGYVVSVGGNSGEPMEKMALCIDFGYQEKGLLQALKGVELILLEANYHPAALDANLEYPAALKERVKSPTGHLSNEQSVEIVRCLLEDSLKTVLFSHLSEKNNDPSYVLSALEKTCGEQMPSVVDFSSRDGAVCWYDVKTGEKTML